MARFTSAPTLLLDWPAGDIMHDFKIGQYVYYVPRRAEGRYVVMRLLPQTKGVGLHWLVMSISALTRT